MSQKQTTILGFATLIAVLAAFWLLFGDDGQDADSLRGESLLPGLSSQINDLATIRIVGAYVSTTLNRSDGGWTIAEKAGHPADRDKVQALLSSLLQAEIERRTTADPERYGVIGLGEAATELLLLDDEGETIAGLALGKRQIGSTGSRSFVRRLDEQQSFLVNNLAEVKTVASDWLPATLLELARSRVARLTVSHADNAEVTLLRDAGDGAFDLAGGLTEGESFTGQRAAERTVTAFTTLRTSDVRPAAEVADSGPMAVLELRTFDGLTLTLALYDPGDETGDAWATLAADYAVPNADDLPQEGVEAPRDGAAEAAAINARGSGWAYRLSASTAMALLRKRDELVTQEETEADDSADSADQDGG